MSWNDAARPLSFGAAASAAAIFGPQSGLGGAAPATTGTSSVRLASCGTQTSAQTSISTLAAMCATSPGLAVAGTSIGLASTASPSKP